MSEFYKEYVLYQHTPILHFQYQENGASIRVSELKPKLDRFLIAAWTGKHENDLKARVKSMSQDHKKFLRSKKKDNEVPALDYSVSVLSSESTPEVKYIEGPYPMYFGNLGDQKKHLLYEKAVKLEFKSTNSDLLKEIGQYLPSFLLWNNFGTRQSKGFGSYFLPTWDEQMAGEQPRYHFDLQFDREQDVHKAVFEQIDLFYRTLRSGINRKGGGGRTTVFYFKSMLWKYLQDVQGGLQWDKRTVKRSLMEHERVGPNQFLWRDVMGLATEQSWLSIRDTLKTKHPSIARMRSPIHFKPLRTGPKSFRVFFDVPPHIRRAFSEGRGSIESNILGQNFELSFAKSRRSIQLPFTRAFDFNSYFQFAFSSDLKTHVEREYQSNADYLALEKIYAQLKSQV